MIRQPDYPFIFQDPLKRRVYNDVPNQTNTDARIEWLISNRGRSEDEYRWRTVAHSLRDDQQFIVCRFKQKNDELAWRIAAKEQRIKELEIALERTRSMAKAMPPMIKFLENQVDDMTTWVHKEVPRAQATQE